ncbi:MAG TPA: branched-chain-amino-acid transaminase [Phycisphaerae bacterium]|nr:branched-chain-amino-acid transaminase [Phycisphaerae bacterium]
MKVKVWLNGKLVDESQAVVSIYDHGLLYGDGVFEGIRVYNGKVFQAGAHLERLFNSADAICLKIPYSRDQLNEAMNQLVQTNNEPYIRLAVTRGIGTLGLNPYLCRGPQVFIINDHIQLYPKELYENGLAVIIARTVRCSPQMVNPLVKSLNYLNNIYAKIEAADAAVAEALMLNQYGNIAEASGDNVFIVKGGEVITPPPEAGILKGITRGIVLELAGRQGLPKAERDFTPAELYAADECFLTGTAAEVVPVTHVDGKTIGAGKAGPVTRTLMAAYKDFIAKS